MLAGMRLISKQNRARVSIRFMNPARNLFLIGPMGAGKTSIGKRLAAHFQLRFIDLDQELEARTGVKIPLIFDIEGEPGFRVRESLLLAELVRQPGILLATGGGSILDPNNRNELKQHGFVLYLETSVSQQLERLARDRIRPLLQTPDREQKLQSMSQTRSPLYESITDLVFRAKSAPVETVAREISILLETHWQREHIN
jgi:shikimate kinase